MRAARSRYRALRTNGNASLVTKEFLKSAEYQELMFRHVPYYGDYGLHEAQTATKSLFRLHPGGAFLVHVPSFSCERWRAGKHSHATFGNHVGRSASAARSSRTGCSTTSRSTIF